MHICYMGMYQPMGSLCSREVMKRENKVAKCMRIVGSTGSETHSNGELNNPLIKLEGGHGSCAT